MSSHFSPTPAELALVNQIFTQSDTQKIGILTGDVAVRVFGGAKLPPTVLGEIWSIADEDNNGFLTRKGVAVAIRLMGWAQKGEKISQALLGKSGPLVNIDGVHSPLVPQGTGMSIPKSPPPALPLLTPQDKAKFSKLFHNTGPVNGLLSGEKVRLVFVKSKLPVDKLSQIWSLADTQDRGALDMADFTIAMYLIQASMSNQLSFIPTSLPPGLYEQAGGTSVVAHATGSSAHLSSPASSSFPPPPVKQPPVQANLTGQPNLAPTHPRRHPPAPQSPAVPPFPGVSPQPTSHWDVTPPEKASADRFFDNLDSHKRGYIEGDVVVPFMLQSKLQEEVLAQVWDLADINKDGRLTRDGFAIAMHLIQGKMSGKDIPATLPSSLVPPSVRANGPASPFEAAPQPKQTEPMRDLLWDDSPPISIAQPQYRVLQPQTTGPLPQAISPPPAITVHQIPEDPFTPATNNAFHKDLLGDDDETHSPPPLHDRSAEIGNLQNHANSTNKSLQNAKAEREAMEATLASQTAQLSALQTQLDSAKVAFEAETGLLDTLKERHANQSAEIQKVREELIRSESDLSAIRVEKAEIEGSFLRDKEEVRDLNRRMAEVTAQIATAKQEVEKTKKDAKQQKGLLAIARKQLATKESEKAKVDQELEEAREDLSGAIREREEAEAEAEKASVVPQRSSEPERSKSPANSVSFAAAHPLLLSPDTTGGGSLSASGIKSNNPFDRLASGTTTPRSESPFRSFSATSIPLPPGLPPPPSLPLPNAATALDDPFGISQVFDSELQPSPEAVPDDGVVAEMGVSTPKGKAMFDEFGGDVVSSPTDEELFSTPPNGTTPVRVGGDSTLHFSSLDTAAAHFPALDDALSGRGDGKEGDETDLSTDLRELDVNGTDSDTDSDEEEEEGHDKDSQEQEGRHAGIIKNKSAPPASFDDIFGPTNDAPTVTASPVPAPTLSADDVFSSPTQNGHDSAGVDAFGVPLSSKPAPTPENRHDSGFSFISTPVNVENKDGSGVSNFDEAFGKTSSNGPSQTASGFSFESAFEDNFDFEVSSGAANDLVPPAPSANGATPAQKGVVAASSNAQDLFSLPVNGGAGLKASPAQARVSFGDTFSSGDPWSAPTNVQPEQQRRSAADQSGLGSISFEEAFGGLDTSQALKLDNSFSPRASNVFTNPPPQSQSQSETGTEAGKQFPAMSPQTSPRSGPRVTSGSSQPRATSPPRVGSPKAQRPSTSSSSTREVVQEKPAPPPRHSKLSIRLPFGKKKKQDTLPPMPTPQSAHPLSRVEEPGAVTTPAVDDDVEPVRHLTAMGFSRNQAVTALEAHDYDIQRALNSLLGS